MFNFNWSATEKKVARTLYDAALQTELAQIMVEFKRLAAAAAEPSDMWDLEDWLLDKRRAFDEKYDYRYSVLIGVFGRLLAQGRVTLAQLAPLQADKVAAIKHTADWIQANMHKE